MRILFTALLWMAALALIVVDAQPAFHAALPRSQAKWDAVRAVLVDEMERHTFPGCVAAGFEYLEAIGNFTYGKPPPLTPMRVPPMKILTSLDMASLTKVLMTTTAMMRLYQDGHLDLDMKGKGDVTVLNLLLHNAGFPPDPSPGYLSLAFGCPQTKIYYPTMSFDCQRKIYASLMNQTLRTKPGQAYVYSDLSMITGMYVVGRLVQKNNYVKPSDLLPACVNTLSPIDPEIAQCYYEAFTRKFVVAEGGMKTSGFLPGAAHGPLIPPEYYDAVRHAIVQGNVSDSNAFALGGIAGHAGLFANVPDVAALVYKFMWSTSSSSFVNTTTKAYNLTQSSRALGWETNNYQMDTYRGCGNLSSTTWYHTGYTGTLVCGDPERNLVTILLTNRAYDAMPSSLSDIRRARQRFNNAVKAIVDGQNQKDVLLNAISNAGAVE